MLNSLLQTLQDLPLPTAIRQSTWMFPTVETVHVLALVLVVSSILMVDLRLVGVTLRERHVDELINRVLPGTWASFALAVVTGSLLFSSNAVTYTQNRAFQIKFVLMFLAGLNMAVFHLGAHRRIKSWDPERLPPAEARIAGGASILLWTGIVFAGRWVGFL